MSASVSIAILNYQRRDALREALEAARSQRHPVEIAVTPGFGGRSVVLHQADRLGNWRIGESVEQRVG